MLNVTHMTIKMPHVATRNFNMSNLSTPTLFFLLFIISFISHSQQEKRLIDDIRAHHEGTAVWWAGHNSWIMKSGDLVVTTDMWLENQPRISPAPITPEELATEIDISLLRTRTAIISMSLRRVCYWKNHPAFL